MQHGCELLSMLTVHCKATNPSPSSEKKKHPKKQNSQHIHNLKNIWKILTHQPKDFFLGGSWSLPSLRTKDDWEVKFTDHFLRGVEDFLQAPKRGCLCGRLQGNSRNAQHILSVFDALFAFFFFFEL